MAIDGIHIRLAQQSDLARINDIYNHYVAHTAITFDFEPFTTDQRSLWFEQFRTGGPHQLFVALQEGEVIGFSYAHAFRQKPAYETTVETTVYCAHDETGRRVGTQLYTALFEALSGQDLRMAVAGVTLPNDASVALHEAFGFKPTGVFHEVGRKFDKYWDVAWYEKRLGN